MRSQRHERPAQQPAADDPTSSAESLAGYSPAAPDSGQMTEEIELAASVQAAASEMSADAPENAAATAAPQASAERRAVASAGIIGIGQLLGSILGFVRSEVLNTLFFGVPSGAFVLALRPIQQISDLLIQGSVSGALIPTFVDYSEEARREELRRVYSTIVNLVLIVMTIAVVAVEIGAPYFVPILAPTASFTAEGQQLAITMVRIIAFSLYGLGLFAVTSGLLYALKEVVFPAFATGIYHIGIILCGVVALGLAAHQLGLSLSAVSKSGTASAAASQAQLVGAHGLAIGAAVGAFGEFLILLPGLRRVRVVWRPVLNLRHPGVRQILRLYGPLLAGLLLSIAQQVFDVYLWGHSPGGAPANATALATGTQLVQFPVGLVAAALSFAVLPLLAAAASRDNLAEYKRTLGLGLRLGLLLMVPAMTGLILLREPIVALLFQHGTCEAGCTVRNALAVQNYAYQLPFVAIDQLLIAAFYARKNTIVPTIVGVISIGFYLLVAVPFGLTIGLPALAFANTMYIVSHAIILFILLTLAIGSFTNRALLGGVGRILLAAAVMGLICWLGVTILPHVAPSLFALDSLRGEALTVVIVGGLGSLAYFVLVHLLGVEEAHLLSGIIRSRLTGRR